MIRELNKTLPLLVRAVQIIWYNRGLWVVGLMVAVSSYWTVFSGADADGPFVERVIRDDGRGTTSTGGWWSLPVRENATSVIMVHNRPEGLASEYSYLSLPAAGNGFQQEIDNVEISSPYSSIPMETAELIAADVSGFNAAFGRQLTPIFLARVLLLLPLWLVGLKAQAVLVQAASDAYWKRPVRMRDYFKRGWAVVGRLAVLKVVLILPLLLISIPVYLLSFGPDFPSTLSLIVLFCPGLILSVGALLIIFIDIYALRALVLDESLTIRQAIGQGWFVCERNFLGNIVLGIILLYLSYGVLAAVNNLIPFDRFFAWIVYSPLVEETFVGMIIAAAVGTQAPVSYPLTIGLMSLIFSAVVTSFFFFLSAWQSAAFTVSYIEFVETKIWENPACFLENYTRSEHL